MVKGRKKGDGLKLRGTGDALLKVGGPAWREVMDAPGPIDDRKRRLLSLIHEAPFYFRRYPTVHDGLRALASKHRPKKWKKPADGPGGDPEIFRRALELLELANEDGDWFVSMIEETLRLLRPPSTKRPHFRRARRYVRGIADAQRADRLAHRPGFANRCRLIQVLEQLLDLFDDPERAVNSGSVKQFFTHFDVEFMFRIFGQWAFFSRQARARFDELPTKTRVKIMRLLFDPEIEDPSRKALQKIGRGEGVKDSPESGRQKKLAETRRQIVTAYRAAGERSAVAAKQEPTPENVKRHAKQLRKMPILRQVAAQPNVKAKAKSLQRGIERQRAKTRK